MIRKLLFTVRPQALLKLLFLMFTMSFSAASAGVKIAKNINYAGNTDEANTLNIYYNNDGNPDKPVLIFIHGGSWSSGKKETYWWLGRNFAKKGVVTVIINYPLAPSATYSKMAADCALAVKWVAEHISKYQGTSRNIFLMGHSAGGHLAELINADPQYFNHLKISNPINGIILNDAFGLDMHEYLTKTEKDHYYFDFIRTFSDKQDTWTLASPLNYSANITNPHLLMYGQKTYEAIKIQTPRLYAILKAKNIPVTMLEVPRRKHVPMISQMVFGGNILYQHVTEFIKNNFRTL